jgi:hypothetical protein
VAIIKDRHARIIIVRPEITLHLEAGYIFTGCSRRNRFFLQFGGGPYIFRQSRGPIRSMRLRLRTPAPRQFGFRTDEEDINVRAGIYAYRSVGRSRTQRNFLT